MTTQQRGILAKWCQSSLCMETDCLLHECSRSLVVFLLIRCANFLSMHCNCSQAPNGTTTYHLSEPPPSMNCETEWAYPNGSTLTFKGETNANQVLGLTRQSITTTVCLGSLKYTVDCVKPQVVNKVEYGSLNGEVQPAIIQGGVLLKCNVLCVLHTRPHETYSREHPRRMHLKNECGAR